MASRGEAGASSSGPGPAPGRPAGAPRAGAARAPGDDPSGAPARPVSAAFARLRRRSRYLPRTLKVTREGRYYLGLTLGVGFAAVNTGNNLLFLILGMLLALIILSGLLSEAALRRLELSRVLPREAHAGEPVLASVVVHNANRVLPAVALVVEEAGPANAEAAPARLFRVGARESARAELRLTPTRRGEVRLGGVRVTTAYPFGIFAKTRLFELPGVFVAFPERVRASALEQEQGREDEGGARLRRGGGEDFHGLRAFRDGDEARHIHWRRSLRVGELLVVEREAPQGRRVTLRLKPGAGEPFEQEVRLAAATAELHLARGDEVALLAPGVRLPAGAGLAHRQRLLTALALVDGGPETEAAA